MKSDPNYRPSSDPLFKAAVVLSILAAIVLVLAFRGPL